MISCKQSLTLSWQSDHLSDDQIELLMKEVDQTSFISYISRSTWQSYDNLLVAHLDGQFAGVLVLADLGGDWIEIGPIIVLKPYRGKAWSRLEGSRPSIARCLLEETVPKLEGKNVFWCSHNRKFIALAREILKFNEVPLRQLPLRVQLRNLRVVLSLTAAISYVQRKLRPKLLSDLDEQSWTNPGDIFAIRTVSRSG
jgi:hypothetical protein